jgi:hypothetical protein
MIELMRVFARKFAGQVGCVVRLVFLKDGVFSACRRRAIGCEPTNYSVSMRCYPWRYRISTAISWTAA